MPSSKGNHVQFSSVLKAVPMYDATMSMPDEDGDCIINGCSAGIVY